MERHDVQSLGFQYGSERFRQEVTSHVLIKIVSKLYKNSSSNSPKNSSSNLDKILSSLHSSYSPALPPIYTFTDKDYVPKTVESVYGKALETLIMEDIATFEKVITEVADTLAPVYFKNMAVQFEKDLKEAEELKKSKVIEEVFERVAEHFSTINNKNLEETPSEDNVNQ